jgi:hypothetical protein
MGQHSQLQPKTHPIKLVYIYTVLEFGNHLEARLFLPPLLKPIGISQVINPYGEKEILTVSFLFLGLKPGK